MKEKIKDGLIYFVFEVLPIVGGFLTGVLIVSIIVYFWNFFSVVFSIIGIIAVLIILMLIFGDEPPIIEDPLMEL